MREIKFRGFDPVSKSFRYAEIYETELISDWITWKNPIESCKNKGTYFDIDQFTGLKDKNGVEIYEGDIVKSFSNINKYSDEFLTDREPTFDKKYIKYKDGAFILSSDEYDFCGVLNYSTATKCEYLEVIGNIHETK